MFDRAAGGPPGLAIGFWAWPRTWGARYAGVPKEAAVGALYLHMGEVRGSAFMPETTWPADVPAASEYWVMWRIDVRQAAVSESLADTLVRAFRALQASSRLQGQELRGMQIDYDCPTASLPAYAAFLARVRNRLPRGAGLSITALLDWFRSGTAIDAVVRCVTEIVPQFYDTRPSAGGLQIAEALDPARWRPVFERLGADYRIGISAFGRIEVTRRKGASGYSADLRLLDLATASGFVLERGERTAAGERRLVLRATRATEAGYVSFEAGDRIEVVVPTEESARQAFDAVRQMGPHCTGLVFYRWPGEHDSTVLLPEEVFRAAAPPGPGPRVDRVVRERGDCSAVHCFDLYLEVADRLPERARDIALHASCDLEYFLPDGNLRRRASMTSRRAIAVQVPAYHGESHLYLGRAMSKCDARFDVEGGTR